MNYQQYQQLVHSTTPKSPLLKDCILAFIFGGSICCFGQLLKTAFTSLGLTEDEVKEISKLKQQLLDNAIDCMSEEASETAIIRQRIKNNTLATSMESASAVIKNAAAARDEAIRML